jgi:hypothetical protein
MIIVWIRDIKGFKIWCISGSENYHVNFYKYFCFIANFFPDTLSIGKMELAQISINFEGLFVNDGGKILRKIRSLRKQCGGENPDLQFPNRPSSYYSHFVLESNVVTYRKMFIRMWQNTFIIPIKIFMNTDAIVYCLQIK